MNKNILLILCFLFLEVAAIAQTITVSPSEPTLDDQITVIYDITQADAGLVNSARQPGGCVHRAVRLGRQSLAVVPALSIP